MRRDLLLATASPSPPDRSGNGALANVTLDTIFARARATAYRYSREVQQPAA
jgi:hypothetical protein